MKKITCDYLKTHFIAKSYEEFLFGKGWYVSGKNMYFYKKIYFHNPSFDIKPSMPEGIDDYIDNKLIQGDNPLVEVSVEDPVIERKTLYQELVKLLASLK